jgi:hypothetical protein
MTGVSLFATDVERAFFRSIPSGRTWVLGAARDSEVRKGRGSRLLRPRFAGSIVAAGKLHRSFVGSSRRSRELRCLRMTRGGYRVHPSRGRSVHSFVKFWVGGLGRGVVREASVISGAVLGAAGRLHRSLRQAQGRLFVGSSRRSRELRCLRMTGISLFATDVERAFFRLIPSGRTFGQGGAGDVKYLPNKDSRFPSIASGIAYAASCIGPLVEFWVDGVGRETSNAGANRASVISGAALGGIGRHWVLPAGCIGPSLGVLGGAESSAASG